MMMFAILLIALFFGGALIALALTQQEPLRRSVNARLIVWSLYGVSWGLLPLVAPNIFHDKALLLEEASPLLLWHIVFAMSSYGLFTAAVIHALLFSREERRIRLQATHSLAIPLLALEQLIFRFVLIGFMLLTCSLFVGAFVGGGTFFTKWHHKTVFAVLSWITFAVLLVGRWRLGWRGKQAAAMIYWGMGFLLLSYVGTRFVLEVILKRGLV